MSENIESSAERLPMWKTCFEKIKTEIGYGTKWPAEFFETALREKRDSASFAFAMMNVRRLVEMELGYYIRATDNGAFYEVLQDAQHEDKAQEFDRRLRMCAVRSINLRSATLLNPTAQLTTEQRRKMEHNLEKASVRLVLLSRSQTIAKELKQHAPKLLEK